MASDWSQMVNERDILGPIESQTLTLRNPISRRVHGQVFGGQIATVSFPSLFSSL